MKKIFAAIVGLAFLVVAPAAIWATGHSYREGQVDRLITKYLGLNSSQNDFNKKGFKTEFQNSSPAYSLILDEGAIKGFSGMQTDGTALSYTAGEFNILYLGQGALIHSPSVSATGDSLPVMAATGLDLSNGNTGANDVDELVGGILGASGRPFVVGTDPAFKFCATVTLNDVSASDQMAIGFRTANSTRTSGTVPYATALTGYTDFATIGLLSGAVTTWTSLSGSDVTTDMAAIIDVADSAGAEEYCVLVSAAGVVTYTFAGSAPSDAVAYTFADGFHIVPFLFYLQDTDSDGANDPLVNKWIVSYQ